MRRLLATAAIVTALLAGAACSTDPSEPDAAGSTGTASVAPSGSGGPTAAGDGTPAPGRPSATAGGNAAQVCAAATRAGSEAVQEFIAALAKMLQASGANDAKATAVARREAEAALDSWAAAVKQQATLATDERLKAVLTEIGTEVSGMRADVSSIDEATLDRLRQRLDTLCGN